MENIKLIVATHKQANMPTDGKLYIPIHVGKKGQIDIGYIGDDTGTHISDLNPFYSELTGLYWAWKNLKYSYLGLVHYRRYFTSVAKKFDENIKIDDVVLKQDEIEQLLKNADVIVPKKRNYYIETIYSHYNHTFDGKHLDITRSIIEEQCPEYIESFDYFMEQRSGYMFNMFIMKKELVDEYCEWLFPILDSLFCQIDTSQMTSFEARYPGRVSERLFNVWLIYNGYKIKEVPFMYLEKVNLIEKGKSFLQAKFLGKKYGRSF
ncbi:TPA: DUF4422 domain-containing protein [Streptococcus suis]|nr:DUF4422 domain-containing protein [Streptococcus suis]